MHIREGLQSLGIPHIGVGAKLQWSFAAVALTTIIASSIGYFSIDRIEQSIDNITQHSVPSMAQAMALAQLSGALENAMPLLSQVETNAKREEVLATLNFRLSEMYKTGTSLGEATALSNVLNQISGGVKTLDELTQIRLDNSKQLRKSMQGLNDARNRLDTGLANSAYYERQSLTSITNKPAYENPAASLDKSLSGEFEALRLALELKVNIKSLIINFNVAVSTNDVKQLEELIAKTADIAEQADINHNKLSQFSLLQDEKLRPDLEKLFLLAEGEDSLFQMRLDELEADSEPSGSELSDLMHHPIAIHHALIQSLDQITDKISRDLVTTQEYPTVNSGNTDTESISSGIEKLSLLLEMKSNINALYGILNDTYQVTSLHNIKPLADKFKAVSFLTNHFADKLSTIKPGGEQLNTTMNEFLSYSKGESSIFELKKVQLEAIANTQLELTRQREILSEVLSIINHQVTSSKETVAQASTISTSTVKQSKATLMMIAITSLVITALVAWLLVTKNILSRLLAVAKALRAISQGDLNYNVTIKGDDELGMLARTVEVFREHALENQRLQKAEIQAQQERLLQQEAESQRNLEAQAAKEIAAQKEKEKTEQERQQADRLKRDTDELLRVVNAASLGDLTQKITVLGDHPAGRLGEGLVTLILSISSILDEISESVELVSNGSQEIARGNTHLADRTKQQSLSLNETAQSMLEMTESVKQNTNNAKRANELVDQAQERAEKGSEVVTDAVNAMNLINDSSLKIKDIVGVIDEIAFQTNLLALNAAVEAARAGNQGRGFAVVASEVRNLASRSAVAAKEIKDLIEDSVSKVDQGVKLVGESGQTLEELLNAVGNVTDIVGDIVNASESQTQKINQVNDAINAMDDMTQSNAKLVTQVASASDTMAKHSQGLAEHIGFFQFNKPDNSEFQFPSPTQSLPDDDDAWEKIDVA